MKMMKTKKAVSGIALLETGILMILLLTLLLGGFGVSEYLQMQRKIQSILDKFVYDTAVKPFQISNQGNDILLSVNSDRMKKYVDSLVSSIHAEANQHLVASNAISEEQYFIEAAFIEFNVDSATGQVTGAKQSPFSYSQVFGSPAVRSLLDSRIRLENSFASLVQLEGVSSPGEATVSKYAAPSGLYAVSDGGFRYMPEAILVGVRMGIKLESSNLRTFLQAVGMDPFIYDFKIITLRGEVEG